MPGHEQVHEDEADRVGCAQKVQAIEAVGRGRHSIATPLEDRFQQLARVFVVLDHDHDAQAWNGGHHADTGCLGRVTVKRVPSRFARFDDRFAAVSGDDLLADE